VYLHGAAGAGTDNLRQITGGNTRGTHVWTTAPVQTRYPAFVVAPQLPDGTTWHSPDAELSPYAELVLELLTRLAGDYSIDPDRVYLVGQSLGGFGTWDLISKRPDVFAAAVPLCGGGSAARVAAARRVAIWAFHGALDQTVPVARSRVLVAALRAAGSSVKYTEYPDVGHDVWTRAFAERDLPAWLFAQKRVLVTGPLPRGF
jgi:predicted peptidase